MLRVRQSLITDIIDKTEGCEFSAYLQIFKNVKSIGNEYTEYGTEQHNKNKDSIDNGVLPNSLKFAFKSNGKLLYDAFDMIAEKELLFVFEDLFELKGELDNLIIDSDFAIISDYKYPGSEFMINDYKYKWIQFLVYSYLCFKNYINIKKTYCQYIMPDYKKIIKENFKGIPFIYEKDDCIKKVEEYIIPKIKEFLNKKNHNPNFSKCSSCFVKHGCKFCNIKVLEKEYDVTTTNNFEITSENALRVYYFIKRAEPILEKLKPRLKEFIKNKNGIPIDNENELYINEEKGKSFVTNDVFDFFIKNNLTLDDFKCKLKITTKDFKEIVEKFKIENADKYIKRGKQIKKFRIRKIKNNEE